MVGRDLKYIMIWCIVIAFLVQLPHCHVVDLGWRRFQAEISRKQTEYTTAVTEAELEDFIRLWPEFNSLNLQDNRNASYGIETTPHLNFKTRLWFLYHKWDAQRFFYIRQRVEEILRIIKLKSNARALIDQLSASKDELSQEMVELQKQRLDTNLFGAEEIMLIQKHQSTLEQLLK